MLAKLGQDIRACTTNWQLGEVCVAFYKAHGIRRMSYHHYPPIGAPDAKTGIAITTHGFPKTWVKTYVEKKLYECDPIVRLAGVVSHPFLWSECAAEGTISPREKAFLAQLAEADLGDGYAIPVDGPHGRRGYGGYGFGDGPVIRDEGFVAMIHAATYLAHCRYCELLEQTLAAKNNLSKRESEALALLALGHSNADIAKLMNISVNTTGTLVQRLYAKLGVRDRVSAVLRGQALGLIPWDSVKLPTISYVR